MQPKQTLGSTSFNSDVSVHLERGWDKTLLKKGSQDDRLGVVGTAKVCTEPDASRHEQFRSREAESKTNRKLVATVEVQNYVSNHPVHCSF
jgi:hypothetical protein